MEDKFIEEFKGLLEAKKADIIKQLASIGTRSAGADVNFDANFPDYGSSASVEDSASEVADYTTNLSLEKELENDLRDVEKALKSVAAGTYGKCKYCQKEIEIERLRIRPESNSCVSCKKTLKGSA
jgi:RNA polymerase-binding transcription factor DksA